jgi:DNA-binding PadR family transcriptional regulator
MVELDMVILGALIGAPAHGYQLKVHIEGSFGKRYVNLSNSSLYPRLAKLEAAGYIEGKREQQEKVPDKKIYHITPSGIVRLKELVATPPGPRETDYDIKSRLVFFGLLTPEERHKLVEPLYKEKLEELKEAEDKRARFAQYMDKYSLAVLDTGIAELDLAVKLYKKLLDMD